MSESTTARRAKHRAFVELMRELDVTPHVTQNLTLIRSTKTWACSRHSSTGAWTEGLAATNPVCKVKFFHANNERVRYLKDDEWERLREAQSLSPYLVDKMVLARNTGLGRANLFRAQWIWVDWLTRVIRIPRTKNNQTHAVPLNDTAYATLKRLYAERDLELDSPYIFVHGP